MGLGDTRRTPRGWSPRAAVIVLAATLFGITVACSSGGSDVSLSGGRSASDGTGTALAGQPPDATDGAGAPGGDEVGTGTPTPEPSIGSIESLISLHGDPPGYDFGRIRIPLLGVDAPVGVSVVDGSSGAMLGSPEGPATVFWYNLDEWPGLGGMPGDGGNAIFGGHADISAYLPYADATYHGPAVFRDLGQLTAGDRIFFDRDGVSLEYVVAWTDQVAAGDSVRWGEIWSSDVESDSITLYTCGGDFDADTASYADRLVVRATAVS